VKATVVRGRPWRWVLLGVVLAAAGVVAFLHRHDLAHAMILVVRVKPGWLLLAIAIIAGVYGCRALVYDVTLRLLGFSLGRLYLWRSAVVATTLHQLIPSGGASGYAFLTYAFHDRGVGGGEASLTALIDTLSNAASVALLVVITLPYLGLTGRLSGEELAAILIPGAVVLPLAGVVFWLQARRDRLVRFLLAAKRRLETALRRSWPDRPLVDFVDQYVAGKAVIARRPIVFALLVALQVAALALDCAAVYAVFLGLGERPDPFVVAMGFVVALAGLTVIVVPGGGGSAEVLMSAFFAASGIQLDDAIAATLLYRLVSFWLPTLFSLAALWRWWGLRGKPAGRDTSASKPGRGTIRGCDRTRAP